MIFTRKDLSDFTKARSLEWLETNGLGGYASGTVSGAHSRRYHGLLVTSLNPPVDRGVAVSKLDETLVIGDGRFELSSNQYPGTIHPQGFQYLSEFRRELFPEFVFNVGDVEIKKTIATIHGENTTVILYEVLKSGGKFTLELLPLYAYRDFHSLSHANDSIGQQYLFQDGIFRTVYYRGCPEIFMSVPGSQFHESKHWYHNFEYSVEQYRGVDFQEDLFTHGKFTWALEAGDKVGIILSLDDPEGRDAFHLVKSERQRRLALVKNFSFNKNLELLVLAADQFIVKRGNLKTIIAGYHWFSDWGRDTMIALPGLCLVTGRYEDAKNILKAFADSVSEGMLPNRFSDYSEQPEYNTIDATLWFFNAIHQFVKYSGDFAFAQSLLPVLTDIIDWHYRGTRYNIKVDEADGLLSGGSENVQLTWMDAKVGDWVVTPRKGKAVEINALWYNALCVLSELLQRAGETKSASTIKAKANQVKNNFEKLFWNADLGCLYDYVDGEHKSADIRPNQIFAISLSNSLVSKDKARRILDTVQKHLLTPRGLRSLAPSHPDYQPVYGGSVWQRDGSYHQGTVWSYLLGPYVDALIHVKGDSGKKEAKKIINSFFEHLNEAGVGSVSEIFDGDAPHHPRGCIAQAWGVGEILRVASEYKLLA